MQFKSTDCKFFGHRLTPDGIKVDPKKESKPVMYVSRALTETEQRYSNIERELLAIVFALERLNHYTFGRTITVQSDHQPLQCIWKKSNSLSKPKTTKAVVKTGTL